VSAAGPLLEIENLKVICHDDRGRTRHAVDCVDLPIRGGQTLGLVGEAERELEQMKQDKIT
jgi:peptide/nickel transport system ATP-binding protein